MTSTIRTAIDSCRDVGAAIAQMNFDGLAWRIKQDVQNPADPNCVYRNSYDSHQPIEVCHGSDQAIKHDIRGAAWLFTALGGALRSASVRRMC